MEGILLIYLNVTESEGRQRGALVAGTSHITWVKIGTYSLFVGDILLFQNLQYTAIICLDLYKEKNIQRECILLMCRITSTV